MYIVPGLDLSLASALKGSCFELSKRNRFEWNGMERRTEVILAKSAQLPKFQLQHTASSVSTFGQMLFKFRAFVLLRNFKTSIYWKTDRRWVNQGTCFYNHANNTYYMLIMTIKKS